MTLFEGPLPPYHVSMSSLASPRAVDRFARPWQRVVAPSAPLVLLRRHLFLLFLFLLGALLPPASFAADAPPFARLNVTVNLKRGASRLPTPFTILPDEARTALYVPETGGILLLRGETIAHHFPIPIVPADGSVAIDDLDATDRLLVGGKWTPDEEITVELHIFDLQSGRSLAHVESRNPHLGGEANALARHLWRVVVREDTVGVYDPRLAASVPLWVAGSGPVESGEQMARMRAGIGFGGEDTWAPAADGSVALRTQGRSLAIPSADRLPPHNPSAFAEDAGRRGAPAAGSSGSAPSLQPPFARYVALVEPSSASGAPPAAWTADAVRAKLVTVSIPCLQSSADTCLVAGMRRTFAVHDAGIETEGGWIRGRPIRVRGDSIYWPYLGLDELEIRRAPIDWLPTEPRSSSKAPAAADPDSPGR